LILSLCEAADAAEGFSALELMATLSSQPLHEAARFAATEHVVDGSGGAVIPLIKMRKAISQSR